MVRHLLLVALVLLLSAVAAFAQPPAAYVAFVKQGDSLYSSKNYLLAAKAYDNAFAAMGGKAYPDDRYNAACSWSMAGNKDSAFSYLGRLATKSRYSNYRHLTTDPDLTVLHADSRWDNLCKLVKQNKDKEEEGLNKPLVAILDTIYLDDQQGRMQLDDVQKKYGYDATEVKALWKQISFKDSIDLIKVARILDQYGWLGADVVGDQGNTTLFLVVQHADLKVQEKYLPMMRNAVKAKRASPSALALLEDRVALREGKKQIYGSQVHGSPDGKNWISPLEDPDNVDKRRAEVGLGPLADYVSQWNIVWDPAQYKKDLPEIEEKEGRK